MGGRYSKEEATRSGRNGVRIEEGTGWAVGGNADIYIDRERERERRKRGGRRQGYAGAAPTTKGYQPVSGKEHEGDRDWGRKGNS